MYLFRGIVKELSDASQTLMESTQMRSTVASMQAENGLRKSSDMIELRSVCVETPGIATGRLLADTMRFIFYHSCLETLLSFRLASRAYSSFLAQYSLREKAVISLPWKEIDQPHLKEKINFAQEHTGISLVIHLNALLQFDNILQLKQKLHNTVSPLLLTVKIETLRQWEQQNDNLFKWKNYIRKLDLQGISVPDYTQFNFILNQLKNFPNLTTLYLGTINFSGSFNLDIKSFTNINKITINHINSNIKFIYPNDTTIFFDIKSIHPNTRIENLDCSERHSFFIKQIQGCYYVSNKSHNPFKIVIGRINSRATINLPEKFGSIIQRANLLDVANTHNCNLSCDENEKKHRFEGVITTEKFVLNRTNERKVSSCCNLWGYTSKKIWLKLSIYFIFISLLVVFGWDMANKSQSYTPQPDPNYLAFP